MDLCNLEPPISDVDALDMLHQTLKKIGGHEDTVRTIWERAAKVQPQKLELQTRWFNHCSERCDWKNAQKVSHRIDRNISFSLALLSFTRETEHCVRQTYGTKWITDFISVWN